MIIAVRQALDYQSTLRAVGVCIIGWAIQAMILMIVFYALGGHLQEPFNFDNMKLTTVLDKNPAMLIIKVITVS